MPVLKLRLNGGSYIHGKVPGVGRVSTWQATPEGLALLRRTGITAGDEFPGALLRHLRDRGLVFTFGSGFGLETAAILERPLASSPDSLPLLFTEEKDGWHWQLVLDRLQTDVLRRGTYVEWTNSAELGEPSFARSLGTCVVLSALHVHSRRTTQR